MKSYTIKEAQEMSGQVIPRIVVKVLKVYDRKTGEGQYGPWSLQNAEIQDSSGKMKLVFSKLPSQASLEGKTMVFKSLETRHGLKGVEAKENTYKDKTTVELKVNNLALIVSDNDEPNVEMVKPTGQDEPPMDFPLKGLENVSHDQVKTNIALAKNRLTQLAGLYDLCWKTTNNMEASNDINEFSQNLVLKKDIASCLFIQSVREGLADKMPIRTLEKFYDESNIKPCDPKNPDMPVDENDLMDKDAPF